MALALLFAAGAQLEVWWLGNAGGPLPAREVAALLTTLPLAWRATAPVPTVALTTAGYAVAVLLGLASDQPVVPTLAPLVALYSLGAHASRRGTAVGVAAALVAYGVAIAAGAGDAGQELITFGVAVLGAVGVGRAVRAMGFESDVLHQRALELERAQDERTRAAVAQERAHIARELHDVIGHSISVMGVQAGAVRRRLTPAQEREREALLAVEGMGRDAVDEMRRLLGVLRSDDDRGPVAAPPTLDRLDDLFADMRRAGVDVELRVEGQLDDISAGRAMVAFRVVQEALTNALKHSPGAHVTARLRRVADALEIEVIDDGNGLAEKRSSAGQGLIGMRERLMLYGGSLEAGPRSGRGFAVRARLPTAGE